MGYKPCAMPRRTMRGSHTRCRAKLRSSARSRRSRWVEDGFAPLPRAAHAVGGGARRRQTNSSSRSPPQLASRTMRGRRPCGLPLRMLRGWKGRLRALRCMPCDARGHQSDAAPMPASVGSCDMSIVLSLLPANFTIVLNGALWRYIYARVFYVARHAMAGRIGSRAEPVRAVRTAARSLVARHPAERNHVGATALEGTTRDWWQGASASAMSLSRHALAS